MESVFSWAKEDIALDNIWNCIREFCDCLETVTFKIYIANKKKTYLVLYPLHQRPFNINSIHLNILVLISSWNGERADGYWRTGGSCSITVFCATRLAAERSQGASAAHHAAAATPPALQGTSVPRARNDPWPPWWEATVTVWGKCYMSVSYKWMTDKIKNILLNLHYKA